MSEPPDKLTKYQIQQLFDGLERLGVEMREGFAEIKRLLDARLESRDKEVKEIRADVDDLKEWRGGVKVYLRIIGAVGGTVLALAATTLWAVMTK